MIVWSGRGAIIVAIAFGSLLASELLTRTYFHDDSYYQQHGWPKLAGFLVAAAITWALCIPRGESLSAINPEPREVSFLRSQDTLFWIPAKFWPLILCAFGVASYFYREEKSLAGVSQSAIALLN
jgi:hypothetical protein